MKVIKDITNMSEWSRFQKKNGKKIGFIPTMGYLHKGHLSLARKAKKECDVVVMSIFVNPIQFGPKEDFKRYPRDFERDCNLAKSIGVDLIFYPEAKKMYPKNFLTYINAEELTETLCGKSRPTHFKGVTTVVAKLFNIVQPDIAYFGQKDAQQAIIIKKMVEDLNFPLKIKIMPTIREKDGLAMSSRNAYLSKTERKDATIIYEALRSAKKLILSGELNTDVVKSYIKKLLGKKKSIKIDYIEIVDAKNLKKLKKFSRKALIAIAVFLGKTRLIDNITVIV
ncbi:MAG: pantoate--beta-alanine ligase [Candidatus Omnitrophica bacterium]|nr:pantoate--beta-alanine ligase [Candidatus Omnitrophota bacterium]